MQILAPDIEFFDMIRAVATTRLLKKDTVFLTVLAIHISGEIDRLRFQSALPALPKGVHQRTPSSASSSRLFTSATIFTWVRSRSRQQLPQQCDR